MKKSIILFGCFALTLACNLPVTAPGSDSTLTKTPPSAPGSDAATPAVLLTETLSITPEPPPPYFTEEFDIPSPYWKFLQAGGAKAPIIFNANGTLRIDHAAPESWLIGVNVIHSYSNVFIRAKTSVNPSGSIGLICRYSETDGWYEFNAASDGTYNLLLGQWLSPGIVKYIPMTSDTNKLLGGTQEIEVGLFCHDGFLELYVKDTLIRRYDATNYGLTEGKIGIASSSFAEVPSTTIFEWVRIDQK